MYDDVLRNACWFWTTVDKIHWVSYQDVRTAKRFLLHTCSPEDLQVFRKCYRYFIHELKTAVQDAEALSGKTLVSGNDIRSYRFQETIGRGRDHYQACFFNPDIIEATPYHEAFSYCIPSEFEERLLTLEFYRDAIRIWREETRDLVSGLPDSARLVAENCLAPLENFCKDIENDRIIALDYDTLVAVNRTCLDNLAKRIWYADGVTVIPELYARCHELPGIIGDYMWYHKA
jgi:hypothetical protein